MTTRWFATLLVSVAALGAGTSHAQFLSEFVGFNDNIGTQEMFLDPADTRDPNDFYITGVNETSVEEGLQTEGAASLRVVFSWADPADPNAWVRLTTFNAPRRPNPALHTQGKVRFTINNVSELFDGNFGLVLGVRETGVDVPQLFDGGTSGAIEWVGVDTTPNGIIAGADFIVDTTAAGDDVQVFPVTTDVSGQPNGAAVILPGPNGVLDTVPAGDDEVRFGYTIDPRGVRRPVPAAIIPPSFFGTTDVEFDLATGTISLDGGTPVGGIAAFTEAGDGVLNAPNNRGTLESLAILNDTGDPAQLIEFGIDELQFEAPVADPVAAPIVVGPIIGGDTQVVVEGLLPGVDRVRLFRNGAVIDTITTGLPAPSVTFTLASGAVPGDVYTATQRNGQTGAVSAESVGVVVVASPPQYLFATLVDEDGNGSCAPALPWELVGALDRQGSFAPIGQPLVLNGAVWQTLDIPLNDPAFVQPSLGGNGELDPSPTGFWTFDSFWFTQVQSPDPNFAGGPWEVLIDSVQLLDDNGEVITTILEFEDGVNRLPSIRGQSNVPVITTEIASEGAYIGGNSHRLVWQYSDTTPFQQFGILQRVGGCGTSELIPDNGATFRFHFVTRELPVSPGVTLPVIETPIVGEQSDFRVSHDPNATSLQLLINGTPSGAALVPDPNGLLLVSGVALMEGDSVSVRQTVGGVESDPAYPRAAAQPVAPTVFSPIATGATQIDVSGLLVSEFATVSEVRVYADGVFLTSQAVSTENAVVNVPALAANTVLRATQVVNNVEGLPSAAVVVGTPPAAPSIVVPVEDGDTTVTLEDISSQATLVSVYANDVLIGSIDPAGAATIAVPVTPLVALDTLTATASNSAGESAFSAAEEVGRRNGTIEVAIGIRETGTSAAIGADGGTSGSIEWLGVSAAGPVGTTIVAPSAAWQTLTFDPAIDPVLSFAGGDGVLSATNNKGTLEHIAIIVDPNEPNRSLGEYQIYIDNVVNVGAGNGGSDVVIADFDSFAVGSDAMFRTPGFSGSTSGNLNLDVTQTSVVTADEGNPGNSENFNLYFRDTSVRRWVRMTTFNATSVPNPTIDLTKPIRFDMLLLAALPPAAPSLVAPVLDGDTTVTVADILPDATLVTVFADNVQIGQVDPNGATEVAVPVTPLVAQQSITARQTVGLESGDSGVLEVGQGNGPLFIAIGIRETGDTGTLGTPGGSTGEIEWVGAATPPAGQAPVGKSLMGGDWVTLTFDPTVDPIGDFVGDGVITETRGTLEHVAIAVDPNAVDRSSGVYRLLIDNVVNVGAGPANSDVVLADFEAFAPGDEVLFQEPTFSGTTDQNLAINVGGAGVTDANGNPGQSAEFAWFFLDTTNIRWIRLTTGAATNTPQPIIDLTKPIRLDLRLFEGGPAFILGDVNGDGLVNAGDIDCFVEAVVSQSECVPGVSLLAADTDGSGVVNAGDIDSFVDCVVSGVCN